MSRSQFRSQPNLYRGRRGVPGWTVATGAVVVAVAGFGFLRSNLPAPPATSPKLAATVTATQAAAPVQEPLTTAPPAAPNASPPAQQLAAIAQPAAPTSPGAPRTRAEPDRQVRQYQAALRSYDASERREGYRWAKQNRVTIVRYCQTARQRNLAFMQGCLDYARAGDRRGRDDRA